MSSMPTFDEAPAPGTIDFGVGQPSADLLPVEMIRTAADDYLRSAQPIELNYGEKQGDSRFRETLATFLGHGYGETVTARSLFITAGCSQALDLVCGQFTKPGDTIFVEEPSYHLAFPILADHGLNVVGIPVDGNGLDIDRLEAELAKRRPALLYTIPTFHNPSGQTVSGARRERLVELSQEHDFLIVADEVYHLLSYCGRPPATLGSLADSGTILSLGSFSKILAPGLRLGWIQSSPKLIERLVKRGAVNSGGCLNHFTSNVVRHAIELGLQEAHLGRLPCVRRTAGVSRRWTRPCTSTWKAACHGAARTAGIISGWNWRIRSMPRWCETKPKNIRPVSSPASCSRPVVA
jgi:DNA-binding transcriptional MocR family regulator